MSWRWLALIVVGFVALGLSRPKPGRNVQLMAVALVVIVLGYKAIRLHAF